MRMVPKAAGGDRLVAPIVQFVFEMRVRSCGAYCVPSLTQVMVMTSPSCANLSRSRSAAA
jgi:hypothetical protein